MAEPGSKKEAQTKGQYDRFAQTARELGCDEDPAHFDEALKKVARHKPVVKESSGDDQKEKTKDDDRTDKA